MRLIQIASLPQITISDATIAELEHKSAKLKAAIAEHHKALRDVKEEASKAEQEFASEYAPRPAPWSPPPPAGAPGPHYVHMPITCTQDSTVISDRYILKHVHAYTCPRVHDHVHVSACASDGDLASGAAKL